MEPVENPSGGGKARSSLSDWSLANFMVRPKKRTGHGAFPRRAYIRAEGVSVLCKKKIAYLIQ